MTNKLIVFRLQRFNIINMFLAVMYLSAKNLYSYCPVKLDGKFAHLDNSQFVDECNQNFVGEFRDINWSEHSEWLDAHLALHSKDLTIGNRSILEVQWLKEHYGNQCITTSFNYTENEYPHLLTNAAEYHIHMIDCGLIKSNDVDLYYKDVIINNRIEFYAREFDKQQLFPKSSNEESDIEIPIRDLVNTDIVADYLKRYGFAITDQAREYHTLWCNKNQNFFI